MEQSNNGTIAREKDIVEDVFGKFSSTEDFINQVDEEEFAQLVIAHTKTVFRHIQEQRRFNSLPLLERIKQKVEGFKECLIYQGGALAGLHQAYGSGGRSMFRDAVNSSFHYIRANLGIVGDLLVDMVTDIIRGKRYTDVIADFNVFVKDVVRRLRKDPENLKLLKDSAGELYAAAESIRGLFQNDVLEPPEATSIYDGDGRLRPLKDIDAEFVTSRCNHVRSMIKKILVDNRQKYNKAATELMRTELSMESVLAKLEEDKTPLPASIPTEKSLGDTLKKDDYRTLCILYESLRLGTYIAA